MTLNGILSIKRTLLSRTLPYDVAKEKPEIVPLDELLQIDRLPFKMTKATMLEVAYMGQLMLSYESASIELEKKLGYEISTTLVREVTVYVGEFVYQNDFNIALETQGNLTSSIEYGKKRAKGSLYIMIDGAAINTRVEDKNGSGWRENKLAMSFASINVIKRGSSEKNGYRIIKKEYTAYIGSSTDFAKFVYQIAINQGYGKYEETIILSDGAIWIRNMCEEIFPDAIQILDKYHLIENIYNFGKSIFRNNEERYKPWREKMIKYIEKNQIEKAISEVDKIKKIDESVVNLKTYLRNNRDKINYREYIKKGYYIGSGAIESANKVILQKRLKQSGMRWSVESAQAVLTLRAKVESGLWTTVVKPLIMKL